MKKSCLGACAVLLVIAFTNAAHGLEPGEFVTAAFLPGVQSGTSDGNPNHEGQGWFLKDMATPLNFYDDGGGNTRWASSQAPVGTDPYWRYSEIKTNATGDIAYTDRYNGSLGIAWIYTNNAFGKYALSFDEMNLGSYAEAQVMARGNANAAWTPISENFTEHQTLYHLAFTNNLGNGGAIALVLWNNNRLVAAATGTLKGLKTTFLERATDTPLVSLSASRTTLRENMFLQSAPAGVVVTANLSEPSVRDTTVHVAFGGTAARDTHYLADAQIVVPAGMTEGSFTLTAIDDSSADGDKTIVVSIGALENAEAGEPTSVNIALLDDDMPPMKKGDECAASVFWGDAEGTAAGNPNPSGQAWYRKDLATPLNAYFPGTAASKWASDSVSDGISYSHVAQETPATLRMIDNWYGAIGVGWVYTATETGLYSLSCAKVTGSYVRAQFLTKTKGDVAWQDMSGVMGALSSGYAVTNWLGKGDALAIRMYNTNEAAGAMNALVDTLKVTLLQPREKETLLLLR